MTLPVKKHMKSTLLNSVFLIGLSVGLTACGATERLKNVGKAPETTRIENPILKQGYQPVSMPMPTPGIERPGVNSLWQPNRTTFFEDQRAGTVGDILTVLIAIDDEAELENESARTRTAGESAGLPSLLGYEDYLNNLPGNNGIEDEELDSVVDVTTDSEHTGNGSIEREEEIDLRMAAVVTQVLPNGNMVITGSQEVRVNFEKRVLQVSGVIRPEDISIANTINHDQIAEARITYGGEGQITDVQQPRYGQQVYDILFPL